LASFDGNSSAETVEVLGRQLQVDFRNSSLISILFDELLITGASI